MTTFSQGSTTSLAVSGLSLDRDNDPSTKTKIPYTSHTLNVAKQSLTSNDLIGDRQQVNHRHGNFDLSGDINVDLRDSTYDGLLASLMMNGVGAMSTSGIAVGTTPAYFSIDESDENIGLSRRFDGCSVNTFTMNLAPNSMVTSTFGIIGKAGGYGHTSNKLAFDTSKCTIELKDQATPAGAHGITFSKSLGASTSEDDGHLLITVEGQNAAGSITCNLKLQLFSAIYYTEVSIPGSAPVEKTAELIVAALGAIPEFTKYYTVTQTDKDSNTDLINIGIKDHSLSNATTTEPLDSYSGSITIGGGPIAAASSTVITSATLNVNNNQTNTFVVGSESAAGMDFGNAEVTGSISAYIKDGDFLARFEQELESTLELKVEDSTGNGYKFTMDRVKIDNLDMGVSGPNSRLVNFDFIALKKESGTTLTIASLQ